MKPESKRKSDKGHEKPSCFDSFAEMSNALNNEIASKNQISSCYHDFDSNQSHSKDCYDFSSLSKTLNYLEAKAIEKNYIEKAKNAIEKKKALSLKKIIKKRQEEKRVVIKPLGMNPKKPIMRIISRDIKDQNSSVGFRMEDFLDAAKHGGFHLRSRFMIQMVKAKTQQKGPKCI